MRRSLPVLGLALCLAGGAAAQPPVLTLEEAVALALESNPILAAETAGARAAEAGVREGRAARWPRLRVSADASRTTDPVAVFGVLLRQERFAARHFDPGFLNEPDPLTSYRASLSIEESLWSGGRIAAGLEGAERAAESDGHLLERARQELVFRVLDRYTAAVVARQAVAVRRGILETARESVRLARDRFETGLVVESDVLQARVRESEAERDAAVAAASLVRVEETALEPSRHRKNLRPLVYVTGDVAGSIESPVYAILDLAERLEAWTRPTPRARRRPRRLSSSSTPPSPPPRRGRPSSGTASGTSPTRSSATWAGRSPPCWC